MKMIVFVALLAAAGCSKKKPADCDSAISKGVDNFASEIKKGTAKPEIQANKLAILDKIRTTLTQRCTEDKWAPEAQACFASSSSMPAMQLCQKKLTDEQRTKLNDDLREITMNQMGKRMPPDVAGHPATLSGSGGAGDTGGAAVAPAGAGAAPAGGGAAPAGAGTAPAGGGAAGDSAAPAAPAPAPAGSAAK